MPGQDLPSELDVLVIGAGISGLDLAHRLRTLRPDLSYAVLESRAALGGTWDLFRYPGVRSDSDMFTLGFPFEPWGEDRSIADGASILAYLERTARRHHLFERIRFRHKVVRADWSSAEGRWTVTVETPHGERVLTCRWLHAATGYYSYESGHTPDFPGREAYAGVFVHPQHWPQDLDVSGRRVVVIGSGATAITLVPALADLGAEVTMLQRSPSYVVAVAGEDALARRLHRLLPAATAHRLVRRKNVLTSLGLYLALRRAPRTAARLLTGLASRATRGGAVDAAAFAPAYDPWDQRLCLAPDGDFFTAVREGRARVVTDTVAALAPEGVRTGSGEVLPADVVVSATGLQLLPAGGVRLAVDGADVHLPDHHLHRGVMLSDVPNLSLTFGYVNASWTLRADLVAVYVCRLLGHLYDSGATALVPRAEPGMGRRPVIALDAGYVRRSIGQFPSQGTGEPWVVHQNYLRDRRSLRTRDLEAGLEVVR